MAIQTSEEAVRRALELTKNIPGMCQQITRGYFDAPSVGDRDGDSDADANDGWASEPHSARHIGDRNPPPGKPLYFVNADGSGSGHRALSLEDSLVRSSDFDTKTKKWKKGVMGTGTIAEVEKALGLRYVGWSSTISGYPIPGPTPPANVRKSRGPAIDKLLDGVRAQIRSKRYTGADKQALVEAKNALLKMSTK